MRSKPWTFRAAGRGAIEILLYSEIGESLFGEGTTAQAFAQELKDAGHVTEIHLRVNSPGGNVFDGLAIFNLLLSHGARVTAQVDGVAASIASVIICAAERIAIGPNCFLMIHNPATFVGGDANEFRKMAEALDKIKGSMVAAYRRHSSLSAKQIGTMMDSECWMSATEALANEFVEEITPDEAENGEELAANLDPRIFAQFKHVPAQIAARLTRRTEPEATSALMADRERQRLQLELLRRIP